MKYINILPRHKYPWLTTLYSMILDMKPKTVIEYGTEHGVYCYCHRACFKGIV
jgi:cephalosporin hydroxylase